MIAYPKPFVKINIYLLVSIVLTFSITIKFIQQIFEIFWLNHKYNSCKILNFKLYSNNPPCSHYASSNKIISIYISILSSTPSTLSSIFNRNIPSTSTLNKCTPNPSNPDISTLYLSIFRTNISSISNTSTRTLDSSTLNISTSNLSTLSINTSSISILGIKTYSLSTK